MADLEGKRESLNLRLDSIHGFNMKQMPLQDLARYFAYHAPSIKLLMPVELIETEIDFQTTDPEQLSSIIEKLGFKIAG